MSQWAIQEPDGILALWNDCEPEHSAFYEHWYQTEHLPERLAIDGFHRGRRYEALDAEPRYFTYYETTNSAVLSSPAYFARLNDPTEATRRVMDGVFTNMSRTICNTVVRVGAMRGAIAITVKLNVDLKRLPDTDELFQLPARLVQAGETIVRSELWQAVDEPPREQTAEEKLRGHDKKIHACLFAEALRQEAAEKLRDQLVVTLGSKIESIGLYQLMCERTSGPGQ